MTDILTVAQYRRLAPADLADSLAEQCRRAGLPAPEREARLIPGRRWRFDCVWPSARLAVEVEGGVWLVGRHQRPAGYLADCEKHAAALVAGWRLLRLPGDWVTDGSAVEWVRRALAAPAVDSSNQSV